MTVVLMTIINIVNKRGKKQKVICENVDCILVKSVRETCTTNRDEHSILLHSILLRYNSRSLLCLCFPCSQPLDLLCRRHLPSGQPPELLCCSSLPRGWPLKWPVMDCCAVGIWVGPCSVSDCFFWAHGQSLDCFWFVLGLLLLGFWVLNCVPGLQQLLF